MNDADAAVVFVNPRAGGGKASRRIADVRRALAKRQFAADFVEPRSVEELRERVRAAILGGAKTFIAMGGDGTLQLLVREAIGHPVVLAVIPLGGGNDFAAALGIRGWRNAIEVIASGAFREVDVARVKFASGEETLYLGGGGMGLDAEAMYYANKGFVKWPGRLRYLAAALAALRKYKGREFEVEFPESNLAKIKRPALLVTAMNTPSYGGGLRLAAGARIDDGMLDVVIVGKLSAGEVLQSVFQLIFTRELSTHRQVRLRTRRVRFVAPAGTPFHGDGEILGKAPVEIEVAPRAVRFLAPKAS